MEPCSPPPSCVAALRSLGAAAADWWAAHARGAAAAAALSAALAQQLAPLTSPHPAPGWALGPGGRAAARAPSPRLAAALAAGLRPPGAAAAAARAAEVAASALALAAAAGDAAARRASACAGELAAAVLRPRSPPPGSDDIPGDEGDETAVTCSRPPALAGEAWFRGRLLCEWAARGCALGDALLRQAACDRAAADGLLRPLPDAGAVRLCGGGARGGAEALLGRASALARLYSLAPYLPDEAALFDVAAAAGAGAGDDAEP